MAPNDKWQGLLPCELVLEGVVQSNVTTKSKKVSLVELKDFTHGVAEVGEQVDQHTKTTKAIGDAVGKALGAP